MTISPLQITIAASHSPPDTLFMENNWVGMVDLLSQWKINACFVWITEKRDGPVKETEVPATYSVMTRGAGARQLHPSYSSITLSVSDVNKKIGSSLLDTRVEAANAAKFKTSPLLPACVVCACVDLRVSYRVCVWP